MNFTILKFHLFFILRKTDIYMLGVITHKFKLQFLILFLICLFSPILYNDQWKTQVHVICVLFLVFQKLFTNWQNKEKVRLSFRWKPEIVCLFTIIQQSLFHAADPKVVFENS